MQYGGYDVYKIYLGVKLHFTTSSYDYIKYNGKNNATLESFTKRKDRYFFHKLSKRYNERDILDYFVANFTLNSGKWIGNLIQNDGREIYLDFKKRKESFGYHFRSDLVAINNDFNNRGLSFDDGFLCGGGQHPRLLRLLIQKRASFQTIVALNHFLSFTKNWDKEITENVVWPKISSTIAKLKPFVRFNITECKLIMKEVFVNG